MAGGIMGGLALAGRDGGASTARGRRCPNCGTAHDEGMESVMKRGAVVVAFDPILVTWRGRSVPLSPVEREVFAYVFRRGRATLDEIADRMADLGASVATRSLVLGHIRGKFTRMGACSPFEKVGPDCIRLVVDSDEAGSRSPVVGLEQPRYATVART